MPKSLTVIALLLAGAPAALSAQSRAELIQQARAEFDADRQTQLLWQAADPSLAPVDEDWSRAVHLLAQTLIEEGDEALANTWLSWAASVDASFPVDTVNLLPFVVQAIRQTRASVADRSADPAAAAAWEWSDGYTRGGDGGVEVATSTPEGATLRVEDSELTSGTAATLRPGTYEMVASAPGYEDVTVTHEILPGVTTRVVLELIPSLPANLRQDVSRGLVRVATTRGGETICRTGLVASSDGLVVTSYESVRDADAVVVTLLDGGRTFAGLSPVVQDAGADLAVFRTDADDGAALDATRDTPAEAWAFYVGACDGEPTVAAAALQGRRLNDPLPSAARRGVVVTREGAWAGLVGTGTEITPVNTVESVLERARRAVLAQATLDEEQVAAGGSGGGIPWTWVGAGVGAVGLAAVLLTGGDDPPGTNGGGETGGIIISLPLRILGVLGGGR